MATLERVDGVVYAGLALNERGYDRLVASGLDEVRFAFGATESFNRRNQNASVQESLEAALRIVERARADAIRSAVTRQRRLRLPVRGQRRRGPRHRARRRDRRGRSRHAPPRRHDRRRRARAGREARLASASRARRPGRRALPQHAQHGLCERARGARGRSHRARCLGGRPRRLSLRPTRDREHRDRGSRLPARGRGRRDRDRPGCPHWRLRVAGRACSDGELEGQVYRAGGFPPA